MGLKITTDNKPVKVIRKDGTSSSGDGFMNIPDNMDQLPFQ